MFVKSVFKCVDTRCTDDLLRQVVHNAVAEAVQSDVPAPKWFLQLETVASGACERIIDLEMTFIDLLTFK